MGKLSEEFQAEPATSGGVREPVLTAILREMSEDDRNDLLEALANPRLSSGAIFRVLSARGYKIGITSIKAYRRGEISNVYEG
jgi:hypothetical protein